MPHLKALRDFGGHGTEKAIQVQVRDDLSQGKKDKNLKIKIQVEVREVLDSEKCLVWGWILRCWDIHQNIIQCECPRKLQDRDRTTEIFN